MENQGERNQPRDDLAIGRNAVLELLKTDRPIDCIYLQKDVGGTLTKIAAVAREKGVVVKPAAAAKLDHMCGHSRHQGVIAQLAAAQYAQLSDLFDRAEAAGEPPFFLIADEIEDPHNLGAIIRTAEAAGAHGLIIPKRRGAGLGYTVSKTSAGAVAHLPVARVPNLVAAMEELKKRGVWIYAADMDGGHWCGTDLTGPLALVVGSEGRGVGRLVKEHCDFILSLPMRGKLSSLNVSVAAGILCYEVVRQRMGLPSPPPPKGAAL